MISYKTPYILTLALILPSLASPTAYATGTATDLGPLAEEIRVIIEAPFCDDTSQCKIIDMGVDACGKPKTYQVYSTKKGNETLLKEKMGAYNAIEQDIYAKGQTMGECKTDPAPKIGCLQGVCSMDMRPTFEKSIDDAITDLSCDDDAQCKSVGIGEKSCGGPSEYKIYSTKTAPDEMVTSLVTNYNMLAKQYSAMDDTMGTCEVVKQPAIGCIQSKCGLLTK